MTAKTLEEELKEALAAKAQPEFKLLDEEAHILAVFQDIQKPNYKRIRKLATKLYGELPDGIQRRLCLDVLRAEDPVNYLKLITNKIHDCALLTKKFIDEGHHGMIFTGVNGCDIYPITLKCLPKWLEEGKGWDPEQEMILLHDSVNVWMKEYNKERFYGKALLYPCFGFTGDPRIIEMTLIENTSGMVQYPGTKYFVRQGAEAATEAYMQGKT